MSAADMKLCLGTAQFGLDYGISNDTGKVSCGEVERILDFCKCQGIGTIDTAQAYGESEKALGSFDLSGINVVTKISGAGTLEGSLENLKLSSVYGVLLHDENEIDTHWARLDDYKSRGLVEKIGASVYSPDKLSAIIDKYPIDIVQFPLNILDQRFLPLLKKLKEKNIEIHVRSVFLQGLLLMDHSQVPEYFDPIKPILKKLPDDKLAFALDFVKNIGEVDKIVIGVTSKKELEEICAAYRRKKDFDHSGFAVDDENMINPSLWRHK